MNRIDLIKPTKEYEDQVMQYREVFLKNGDTLDGCALLEEVESYDEWINFKERLSREYGDGYVPSEVYLAVRKEDNKVVGIIDFKTRLSDFLLNYGGNIGYSVLPEERRKGYAKEMLKLILNRCREFGLEKILITCDKENEGSRRTIIANGGILENEVIDEVGLGKSGTIQRYWIEL